LKELKYSLRKTCSLFLDEPDSEDKCRGLLSILEPCGGLMNMYLQNVFAVP